MVNRSIFLLLLLIALGSSQSAASKPNIDTINDQLERPWGMTILPDGRFLVTEKVGRLRIIDTDGQLSAPVEGLPDIDVVGQGGLLDVEIHPNFKLNRLVYLSYVAGSGREGYGTEVVRGVLDKGQLTNIETIFVALPKVSGGHHFGSRLVFDNQQYLYISLGDRGQRQESQNLRSHIGSIIRLHDDGQIPKDNPFVDTSDALPAIYSYGHRNIQGLTLHPQTGDVWSHEHGPQGGDEVNIVKKGKNYGWPIITYGAEYGFGSKIGEGTHKTGMEQPLHYWDPSIAPSGMAFYKNDLLVGALKFQLLARLTLDGHSIIKEDRLFARRFGRIRDVHVSNDSTIYLLTDANNGKLIRITGQL